MGAVTAVAGMITNTKIYYDCPGCGKRVWAYPGFEGNRCWDCPGTIIHGATRAVVGSTPIVSDIVDNVSNTVLDTVSNNKQYYHCPHCGAEKWAYGMFKGTACWECGKIIGTLLDATRKTAVDNSIKPVAQRVMLKPPNYLKSDMKYLSPHGLDMNHKIIRVKVKSVWLVHGGFAALGSAVSGTLTNNSVTHWWVSIETRNENIWYCAMFDGEYLGLSIHASENEVTKKGKSVLVFGSNDPNKNITIKHDGRPYNMYIKDVVKFMEKYDGKYDLHDNNCQTFARALFKALC